MFPPLNAGSVGPFPSADGMRSGGSPQDTNVAGPQARRDVQVGASNPQTLPLADDYARGQAETISVRSVPLRSVPPDVLFGARLAEIRAVQGQLIAEGLFAAPVQQAGRPATLHFAGCDLETARGVGKVFLAGEELHEKRLSLAERQLREIHAKHPEEFARSIQLILERNPWSLVARNEAGEVSAAVMIGLVHAREPIGLPGTSVCMTRADQEDGTELRRSMVDFWVAGKDGGVVIDASLELAKRLRARPEWGIAIEKLYAYSNPRQLHSHPELSAEAYAQALVETEALRARLVGAGATRDEVRAQMEGKLQDIAGSFHAARGAELVRIIAQAFPLIHTRDAEGAIGRGFSYIWEYHLPAVSPA